MWPRLARLKHRFLAQQEVKDGEQKQLNTQLPRYRERKVRRIGQDHRAGTVTSSGSDVTVASKRQPDQVPPSRLVGDHVAVTRQQGAGDGDGARSRAKADQTVSRGEDPRGLLSVHSSVQG